MSLLISSFDIDIIIPPLLPYLFVLHQARTSSLASVRLNSRMMQRRLLAITQSRGGLSIAHLRHASKIYFAHPRGRLDCITTFRNVHPMAMTLAIITATAAIGW
ncbi:MAG: hypothetical protein J0653_01225 [Deltaproteobacteria bacterium]|nr:hypothetical protein [Deltaproteobacteria bacterium]